MHQPPSRWLASPPSKRLRVGDCVVDVPLREIVRPGGASSRVTLKSIGVLLVLAEHAGNVVSRDALLEAVWPGTMPTMDVVTQAVASLRKALDGEGETPGYVETIPKTGYRLIATIQWLPDASAQPGRAVADPQSRWRPVAMIAAGLALLATLGWSMAGWQAAPRPAPVAEAAAAAGDMSYTLLTSRPGGETEPALSPDGASVAYAMSPDIADPAMAIYVQSTQPIPPRQLTMPPPGHTDLLPRWSPDGRQLMFIRGSDSGECEFRVLPVHGGVERAVGDCDRVSGGNYDWLPDGSGIVAGIRPSRDGEAAPLSILHLDTGQWQPMDYPIEPGNVDFDPRFSADGSRLGFRRNLGRSDIWVMPAAGGAPKRVTHLRANITGWDWLPDGDSLLLGLRRGAPQLLRHDIAGGRSVVLGRMPAIHIDVAAHGDNMVFAVDDTRIAMFRHRLPLGAAGSPQPLFPSTGTDLLPSPSPDGRMVAFHSDRSRERRLWIGEPGNPERLRMIGGFIPISTQPPRWSPDGSRLLAIGEPSGAAAPGPQLYEVDVASGRSATIALGGVPYLAQYLPDGRLLALVDLGTGKWSLQILDLASPGRVFAQVDGVGDAGFDPDSGQVYFVRIESPGLWRAGLDLAAPVLVDDKKPVVYWMRRWSLLEGRPFTLLDPSPGCASPWQWMGTGSQEPAGCLDREHASAQGMAVVPSRDGNWLYTSAKIGKGSSDIGMLQLGQLGLAMQATP